jgi:hypothetical protein
MPDRGHFFQNELQRITHENAILILKVVGAAKSLPTEVVEASATPIRRRAGNSMIPCAVCPHCASCRQVRARTAVFYNFLEILSRYLSNRNEGSDVTKKCEIVHP